MNAGIVARFSTGSGFGSHGPRTMAWARSWHGAWAHAWRHRRDDRDDRARHLGDQMVVRHPRRHGAVADGRRGAFGQRGAARRHDPQYRRCDDRDPAVDRLHAGAAQADQALPLRLGRVEDLAGIVIVLIILFSAIVAGYQAIDRLIHPQAMTHLGWLTAAGIIGFLGNEAVAVFRIRVGREINSAALIADGYHARTDGLTSLAVVAGAIGVWLGFPLADPIVGLLITIAIFGIVWQSARSVLTRMLDGVEPGVIDDIHHAAEHVPGHQQDRRGESALDRPQAACRCGDRHRSVFAGRGKPSHRGRPREGTVRAHAGAGGGQCAVWRQGAGPLMQRDDSPPRTITPCT